jgi:hypothetical protein
MDHQPRSGASLSVFIIIIIIIIRIISVIIISIIILMIITLIHSVDLTIINVLQYNTIQMLSAGSKKKSTSTAATVVIFKKLGIEPSLASKEGGLEFLHRL